MYDLQKMTLRDMTECGFALRHSGKNADSMEDVSNNIIQYLNENLVDKQSGEKSCVLIRFFKTHPYTDLTPELQEYTREILGSNSTITEKLKCLILMATAGELPEWNSRHQSEGHKSIPLISEETIARIPMISQLIQQLGLNPGAVVQPDANLLADLEQQMYNVFYISDALSSSYIPAQDSFVIPFNVKSVIGFGGLLPSGNMFVILMFLKVNVPRFTIDLIRPLALNVKMAILPFDNGSIFNDYKQPILNKSDVTAVTPSNQSQSFKVMNSQIATLNQLLDVHEQSTITQSDRLQKTIAHLQQALDKLQKTQVQLIHTEKMSSLGQMVAGLAHEISNPITFINGNLDYAEEYIQSLLKLVEMYPKYIPDIPKNIQNFIEEIELDYLTEDLRKIFIDMKVGTERITEIIQSLRNFSRIDESEFQKVDIHGGIDSNLMILKHRLKSQTQYPEIKIIKEYQQLPKIECSPGLINQVFMNILANAIDAIQEAVENGSLPTEPTIRIRTSTLDHKWVVISIADNGSGIKKENTSKLFEPFFTTKPMGKGTGIGLSISYEIIVEKHGGKISCNSTPGQGTEFVIEIPIYSHLAPGLKTGFLDND
ncbi:MAG: ATP-binding protein [Nostocaceae cyanobacterium]|nr:ATP-binding protein [Nostocaceae cyanobacterium]